MKIPSLPENNPLQVSRATQYRTVEELIEKSKPNFNYYALLILSSLIITAGLLLNNTAIVIGGMLVTPLLTPLLAISLGLAVGEGGLIVRISKFILQSFAFVVGAGLLLTLIFGGPSEFTIIENSLRSAMLYFVVAVASGIAATFAWIQKEVSETLPGIAIAVSLVPPLALIGIGFGTLNLELAGAFFTVFALNLFGIIMGSLVVFNMSKFNRSEKKVKEKNEEVVVETHLKKLEKDMKKEERQEELAEEVEAKKEQEGTGAQTETPYE